jgi:hypothetical protein
LRRRRRGSSADKSGDAPPTGQRSPVRRSATLAIGNLRTANPAEWVAKSTPETLASAFAPNVLDSRNPETQMKLLGALTILAVAAAGPAFAEGKCSSAPKSQWRSQSTLASLLQADGYTVRRIKVEGGCYEVYATDKDGKRANMAYNAETLEKLDNAEAGEN